MTNSGRPDCAYKNHHLNRDAHKFIKIMEQLNSKRNWLMLLGKTNVKTERLNKIGQHVLILLTLFRIGFFRAAHGWGGGRGQNLSKICHTYPTTMKLDTVIPYLRKFQKLYESPGTPFEFCWHQHFLLEISKFCYIKKYRYRFHLDT